MRPRIFVSAVSAEFKSTRQLIANILVRLGYEPITQEILGTEPGNLTKILSDKVDACDGLIQIVGQAYGEEPPSPLPDFGRVSYTQFEMLYAQSVKKRVWIIIAKDDYQRDAPLELLDIPTDLAKIPKGETIQSYQEIRRNLQRSYSDRIIKAGFLRSNVSTTSELELVVERMKDELGEIRRRFDGWQKRIQWIMMATAICSAVSAVLVIGRGGNQTLGPDVQADSCALFFQHCESFPFPKPRTSPPDEIPDVLITNNEYLAFDSRTTRNDDDFFVYHFRSKADANINADAKHSLSLVDLPNLLKKDQGDALIEPRENLNRTLDLNRVAKVFLKNQHVKIRLTNESDSCVYLQFTANQESNPYKSYLQPGEEFSWTFARPLWYHVILAEMGGKTIDFGWLFLPPVKSVDFMIDHDNSNGSWKFAMQGRDIPLKP